jgi:hypothetical protein
MKIRATRLRQTDDADGSSSVPANALLDENGVPLLDENNQILLDE